MPLLYCLNYHYENHRDRTPAERTTNMKKWKKVAALCLSCAMLSGSASVFAETTDKLGITDTSEDDKMCAAEAAVKAKGQLTMDDLVKLNGGQDGIFVHNNQVTFVDGTCTENPVTSEEEASAVVDSMMTLIGADANTEFIPWRDITDPMGNRYYIFQQIYEDTTVCGGAVKVITDKDGKMIALSSSVESEMPDVADTETEITAEQAEEIAAAKVNETFGVKPEVLSEYTGKVIIPKTTLSFDIEDADESSRMVWVVYTNNPAGSVQNSSDLPYLAHYITVGGEYLYDMPAILPGDEAGNAGSDASYIFEFMEPAEYTGYVDLSDGTEKEISVTVMRDRRTGMYYLGNLERRIVIANCYDFLYNNGQVVLESSPDNKEWDQVGLLSLYNYCRAWDYYNEIGWTGGDGEGTPIIVLNNFCDDHYNEINNACYMGKLYGMQCFAASKINDYSQCLDVIAHEFTHCVTGSVMTYNSYMNDYGAINEAMSDIQGKNCDVMSGDVEPDNWWMGANSVEKVRNMQDPHQTSQPEYTWDFYYQAKVKEPTAINDHGGVHTNSSLLNRISYLLRDEGGMTTEEARVFWFITDCAMVPQTDHVQLSELLPWALKASGMEKYADVLQSAIEKTCLSMEDKPESIEEDRAIVTLNLPDSEAFDTGNWIMSFHSIKADELIDNFMTIMQDLKEENYSILPESVQQKFAELAEEQKKEDEKSFFEKAADFVTTIADAVASVGDSEKTEEPAEEQDMEPWQQDLLRWIGREIGKVYFQGTGSAGQDGSTVNMVVPTGYAVPILLHATVPDGSDAPDQVVIAAYLNGKWYDLGLAPAENPTEEQEAAQQEAISKIVEEVFGNALDKIGEVRSLNDVLDLFATNVQGGQTIELSSEGLDQIVIPEPTPLEEKEYSTIEPGKKSRPKTEAEAAETATEAEAAADETATEEAAADEIAAEEAAADETATEEAAADEAALDDAA